MSTLSEELRELRELRERRDDAKAEHTELSDLYAEKESELIERMAEEDTDLHKTGGITYSPQKTVYGQITDRAAFVAWAEENDEELVEKKERKQLINQLARTHVDDGAPLPPGMGFYVKEFIGQRASS